MSKLIFPLLALLALAACNTVEGAGQDISTAGDVLTDEARQQQGGT
jgi:predicted small secreted protein